MCMYMYMQHTKFEVSHEGQGVGERVPSSPLPPQPYVENPYQE